VLQATRADTVGTFFVFLHLLKRQANGNNPAYIIVGDTINDLDATISGPQADLNLGIKTYVNGTEMRPVQINTSTAATDTIDYVVTNQTGLTGTSTRTVIARAPDSAESPTGLFIEAALSPSITPKPQTTSTASSTAN
jgi:spore maturation protein SpmA